MTTNAKGNEMYITQRQIDLLRVHCRNWLDLRWGEYTKTWSYGGVHVRGNIENLREQIAYAEQRNATIWAR